MRSSGIKRTRAQFDATRPKIGDVVVNPPFSKNKPTKRLYTMEDARQWDEDRYAR